MNYPSTCCLLRQSTLYLCAWILTVGQAVYGQNIAPSPNATALGTYANVPVNNYTGVPDISIPLHTVTSRDISLPITLSYHASGIKVAQEASWVGLGWALQAGGVITRTIRGEDDLVAGFPDAPELPAWDEDNNLTDDPTNVAYLQGVCAGTTDAQPDLFYFSLPGHTGKFILGQRESNNDPIPVHLVSQEKMEITFDSTPTPSTGMWTIVTADGYRYEFGTVERTNTFTGTGDTEVNADADLANKLFGPTTITTTAWYLDKITSPTGNEITFEYDDDFHDIQSTIYRSLAERQNIKTQMWAPNREAFQSLCQGIDTYTSSQNFVSDMYLERIVFNNGSLEFQTSDRTDMIASIRSAKKPQRLQQIVLKALDGTVRRKFVFDYDYFNAGQTALETRLKLTHLIEYNQDVAKAPYQFTYDEANTLPTKDSKATDYWGYFNNQTGNTTLLPALTVDRINPPTYIDDLGASTTDGWDNTCRANCTDYASCNACWTVPFTPQPFAGAIKTANLAAAQTATLAQITYPTGGTMSFTYDLHDFSAGASIGESVTQGAGLRIAQITANDEINPAIITRYEYTREENNTTVSSGRLMSPLVYYYQDQVPEAFGSGVFSICHFLTRQSGTVVPLGTSAQGNLVGYDRVTVLHGAAGENGKTEYVYRNQEETLRPPYFPNLPNFYAQDNGLLEMQTEYARVDNDYQLIRSVETTYPPDPVAEVVGKGLATFSVSCQQAVEAKFYDIVSQWWHPTSTIVRQYDQDNPTQIQQTTTSYQYANADHKQLTLVSVTDSEDNNHITRYAYAEDFVDATDPNQFGSNLLRDSDTHMHSQVLRQTTEVGGSETQRVTTTYDDESGHVLPQSTITYPDGLAAGESITTTYRYDDIGNVVFQQPQDQQESAFLWGYNRQYPIAQVVNAKETEVFYTGFEEDTQDVSAEARTGRQSHSGSYQVTLPSSGTYRLTYWRKPNGQPWQIETQTISASTTIGATNELIDDVRVYPLDALMTSFTYDPLYGRTSTTGPDGMIHYQEYDDLGRLKLTRDHRGRIEQNYIYRYQQ